MEVDQKKPENLHIEWPSQFGCEGAGMVENEDILVPRPRPASTAFMGASPQTPGLAALKEGRGWYLGCKHDLSKYM